MNIPKQIKVLRKSQGISQQELADKSGISRVSIGQIERGNAIPSIPSLQQIVSALNCELVIYIREGRKTKTEIAITNKEYEVLMKAIYPKR